MAIQVSTLNDDLTIDVKDSEDVKQSAPESNDSEKKEDSESGTEEVGEEKEKDESEEDEELTASAKEKSKDEDDDESESEEVEEKPKKKGGFQRRIDKLNSKISAKESEAEYWKKLALDGAGKKPVEEVESKQESNTEGKPSVDDFDDYSNYIEAIADWKAEQKFREFESKREADRVANDRKQVFSAHAKRVESFAEKTEDFQEVIESVDDIHASDTVQEVIVSSENGPKIMYELAKNREEYARICKLPPLSAARELGKIEARLDSKPPEKSKPKKVTKAPEPITPVGSKGGRVDKSIYEAENMTQKEYEAARAKQRSA